MAHRRVAVLAEHGDVARLDRCVTDRRQLVDRGQIGLARVPEDDARALGDDMLFETLGHARNLAS